MGFNLSRRFTPRVILDQPVYSEKRLKETVADGKTIVSVVDCDLSHDSLPAYDAFPLEAQLASGVPINQVNPAVVTDNSPSSVASKVEKIITVDNGDKEF